MPVPMYPEAAAIAVALVLSFSGNHRTESRGGVANVILVAIPLNTDPTTISLQHRVQ